MTIKHKSLLSYNKEQLEIIKNWVNEFEARRMPDFMEDLNILIEYRKLQEYIRSKTDKILLSAIIVSFIINNMYTKTTINPLAMI